MTTKICCVLPLPALCSCVNFHAVIVTMIWYWVAVYLLFFSTFCSVTGCFVATPLALVWHWNPAFVVSHCWDLQVTSWLFGISVHLAWPCGTVCLLCAVCRKIVWTSESCKAYGHTDTHTRARTHTYPKAFFLLLTKKS